MKNVKRVDRCVCVPSINVSRKKVRFSVSTMDGSILYGLAVTEPHQRRIMVLIVRTGLNRSGVSTGAYGPLAKKHGVPIVVTGFEPIDLLRGVLACVRQLEEGRAEVENAYERAVRDEGNPTAREMVDRVFEPTATTWRGIGEIPDSGLRLREAYRRFDATAKFDLAVGDSVEDPDCRAGDVLRGACKPTECSAFGNRCTPDHPLGAPMVSSEGACAAYYRYRRTA